MNESMSDTFRWQGFFQKAEQPVLLLNRQRRVLFVNRAWEACTGLTLAEVKGRACRRRSSTASLERDEAILAACAPPADALAGRPCKVRRRVPQSANWWEIQFLPLMGSAGLLGILGSIHVLVAPKETPPAVPERLMALRDRHAARHRLDDLEPHSPAMERLLEQARLAAQTRIAITIVGEPGAGKQWLARAIHNLGDRRQRNFACLDAERIPPALLADLLFDPIAQRQAIGTIYLREPSYLPREWQARLVEVLQRAPGPDEPRYIVSHHSDPRREVQAGRLLEELHCAASAVTIVVPPLRERLADLPRLIDVFLKRSHELQVHAVNDIGSEAGNVLRTHPWPGNLRELQDVLTEACRHTKSERIELADLPFYLKQSTLPAERRLPLDTLLEQVERRLIELALKLTQGNQTRAAELLDIWRPRLMRRMEKFGLKGTEEQGA